MATAEGKARLLQHHLDKKRLHRPFDFDAYFPLLRAHTWPSSIIPFPPPLARACVNYYQARFNGRRARLRQEDVALLRGLEASLDSAMAERSGANSANDGASANSFFVRMSNRSPKDGYPLDPTKLYNAFVEEINARHALAGALAGEASRNDSTGRGGGGEGGGRGAGGEEEKGGSSGVADGPHRDSHRIAHRSPRSSDDGDRHGDVAALPGLCADLSEFTANEIMVAYSGAQMHALCVDSGRAAMCLLLSSERVYSDLHLALDCNDGDDADEWQTYLILRDWDDELRHDWVRVCMIVSVHVFSVQVAKYKYTEK